jgi:hypothetical protein
VATAATDARAVPDRPLEPIAVASDDPAFRAAVSDALAPAGMIVRITGDAAPAAITDMTAASRAIAEREHAMATVWLVFVGAGATLIAYDRGVDRMLVRSLPYGAPLSAAQAAEAARMTRTMLRALRTPDSDLLPPHADDTPAVVEPVAVIARPTPTLLAIDVDGGVRVRGPGSSTAIAGALSVIWRPDGLGIAATARFAPSSEVTGTLMGRISDQSVALTARMPLRVAPRIDVAASAGAALHFVDLNGTLGDKSISELRFDPAIRVGLAATYELGPTIAVGLGVSLDSLLRRQTYQAGTEEVAAIPLVQLSAGILVTARIL